MPASNSFDLATSSASNTLSKPPTDTITFITCYGTFTGAAFTVTGSADGTNYAAVPVIAQSTGQQQTSNACSLVNSTTTMFKIPSEGLVSIKVTMTALSTGTVSVNASSNAYNAPAFISQLSAVVTTFPGSGTIGASTAAAGSTTADAGVLPAGTAKIYPTTAADDTKGVRIHASDQVSGNVLFIGNGVSNKILKVYAPSGGVINGASADAAFSSASGKGVLIVCLSATGNTWLAA